MIEYEPSLCDEVTVETDEGGVLLALHGDLADSCGEYMDPTGGPDGDPLVVRLSLLAARELHRALGQAVA